MTGKFRRGQQAPAGTRLTDLKPALLDSAPWEAVESLAAFAAERDLTMVEVAFGWLLSRPQVASVIAGATSVTQVLANAAASGRWTPERAELDAIDLMFEPPVALGYR